MGGQCKYVSRNQLACQEADLGNGYCFWHDPDVDKSNMDLTEKLQAYAHKGGLTRGLKLKRTNLKGLNLVKHDSADGFDFSECDFYRANLQGAHLFNITLQHGSLMKANLHEANLHCADLEHTNLLGIKLHNAKLDNLEIGSQLSQERLAHKYQQSGEEELAKDHFEQAEEIYRHLRRCAELHGLHGLAGNLGYKELIMHRHLMPFWSFRRGFSYLVDILCGYGEKPENTVLFSLALIIFSALGYFSFGVHQGTEILKFDANMDLMQNTYTFMLTLYYSVVTFTTLGYGDITPYGISRLFAAIEAFIGSFTIALFVVVFVKRMTR
jgi:uncharacterized protein YjbI with pentapeptide repeats